MFGKPAGELLLVHVGLKGQCIYSPGKRDLLHIKDWFTEDFGFLKKKKKKKDTEMLWEHVFGLIPGVDLLFQRSWLWFALCSSRGVILPAEDSFCKCMVLRMLRTLERV